MRNPRFGLGLFILLTTVSFIGFIPRVSAAGSLTAAECGSECAARLNALLAGGGTVTLGAGTFNIDSTLHIPSNTTLTGARGSVIRLINHAAWDRNIPMLEASGKSGVRIYGFEIDGNKANNQDYDANHVANNNTKAPDYLRYYGHGYYDMILLRDARDVEIHDMYLHHNLNDIVLAPHATNLKFYNNTVRQQGHATVYVYQGSDIWMYNNDVEVFCNAGMRSDGSTRFYVYNNTFFQSGGQAAVELQGTGEIWICNNVYNNCTQLDRQTGGSNPFTGTIHTTGCPTAGGGSAPGTGSASTDNGADGSGGGTGGDGSGTGDGTGSGTGTGDGSGTGSGSGGGTPSQNTGGEDVEVTLPGGRASDPANRGGDAAVDPIYTRPETVNNDACVSEAGSAGLIPCGKSTDDPNTANNECAPCDMRSFLLMGQLIIEFMLKLAGIAATLAIIVGGFLYVFALGKPEKAKQAKSIITSTLIGFVVVFIAWAVVASILTTLGYIDPLDGVWYAI